MLSSCFRPLHINTTFVCVYVNIFFCLFIFIIIYLLLSVCMFCCHKCVFIYEEIFALSPYISIYCKNSNKAWQVLYAHSLFRHLLLLWLQFVATSQRSFSYLQTQEVVILKTLLLRAVKYKRQASAQTNLTSSTA